MMRREQRFVVSLGNEQYLGELEFAVMHKFKITVEEFDSMFGTPNESNFNFFLCVLYLRCCSRCASTDVQEFSISVFFVTQRPRRNLFEISHSFFCVVSSTAAWPGMAGLRALCIQKNKM